MSAMVLRHSSHHEPGKFLAGVLALLVHAAFVVFMFFGLNWKSQAPQGMVVDLWHDLPQPVQPVIKQPLVKTEPSQPKTAEQPAQEKSLPPKIASPSPPKKPQIVRKEKKEEPEPPVAEKEPVQEMQKENEQEKQREKEKEEEKQREKEKAEKAEAQRLEREQALQQQREQEALAAAQYEAQQAAERARIMNEIAKYKAMILAKVRSRIVMPPDLPGNPMTEFSVTLLPGGDILDVQLRKPSGFTSFDSAVERAIFLSKPLPLPPNPALFREFRNLNITVHYHE